MFSIVSRLFCLLFKLLKLWLLLFLPDDRSLIKSNATFIICPASVLHQWKAEIERRCKKGLLSVLVYHGPDRTKDINRFVLINHRLDN